MRCLLLLWSCFVVCGSTLAIILDGRSTSYCLLLLLLLSGPFVFVLLVCVLVFVVGRFGNFLSSNASQRLFPTQCVWCSLLCVDVVICLSKSLMCFVVVVAGCFRRC